MISEILKIIGSFFILILIQVLILNNIQLGGYINPYLYVFFILMLPFETPKWLVMVLAFIIGVSIDLFSNTAGMHTFASVFMGFTRPYILELFSPREGYIRGTKPTMKHLGTSWFLSYAGILIFMHHLLLFYLEVFRFNEFFATFFRVIMSSLFTMLLVVVSQFLITRTKEK